MSMSILRKTMGRPQKMSAQNCENLTPSLLSAKCRQWLTPSLSVQTHQKLRKARIFCTKKCGRPHLKKPPPCQHWATPPDCRHLLSTRDNSTLFRQTIYLWV